MVTPMSKPTLTYFDAPMSRGEAYRHIHLVDAKTGREVEAPFLELGEELWDGDFRRFTLLCDPGRVKRGLKPRERNEFRGTVPAPLLASALEKNPVEMKPALGFVAK